MKVLVTGGAGFIGSNLIKRLTEQGVSEISVIDDLSTGFRSNLAGLDVEFFEASILDYPTLKQAAHGSRAIVHLAARPSVALSINEPIATNEVNTVGTLHVLEVAREAGAHVTIASSSAVYGESAVLPLSESLPTIPISPYAASKLASEAYGLSYQSAYDLPVLPLRFFNVYGPKQTAGHAYASVIPSFIEAALEGSPLTVHGDGEQTRDFVFVDTVTEIIWNAIESHIASPHPLNLALGSSHSLLDVIKVIEEVLGASLEKKHTEPRAGDIRDSVAATAALSDKFPKIEAVSLEDGIAKTIEWFRQGM